MSSASQRVAPAADGTRADAPTQKPTTTDPWAPLREDELHIEPLEPFTWRTTLWSAIAWPLPALSIFFWLAVFWIAHHTFWNVGTMFRLPRFAARMTMWLGGVRVKVYGAENLDLQQRYLFVGNHVSMFDAPVGAAGGIINARTFQEEEHTRIPVYGSFVKMFDTILVKLRDPASREAAFAEARRRLDQGQSFGVFPEGKRAYEGKLLPFYDGAFRLAIEAQVPIAPACFRGLRNICPPTEWRARPGVVEVMYGEPIPTQGMTLADVPRLRDRARRTMNDMLRDGPPPGARAC